MVDIEVLFKDVLETKGELRELKLRIDALLFILEKEGVVAKPDFEQVYNEKLHSKQ